MTLPAVGGQVDDSQAVVNLANYVLDTIVGGFDAASIALPERRLIVIGELTVDTECLGVMFGGLHVGPPGNEVGQPYRGEQPRTCIFDVELWRKITTGGEGGAPRARARVPNTSVVTAQAQVAMVDSWVLLQSAYLCDQMNAGVIASTAPLPPQGGLQGISLSLSLQVP